MDYFRTIQLYTYFDEDFIETPSMALLPVFFFSFYNFNAFNIPLRTDFILLGQDKRGKLYL